ncbi:MAG: transcriptional repressor [Actinobacteria bacterium]|jgi:Fe2+ or Zn2+ uptake regulation protein|nr:transcriptional repressor [Actinomycetota bacterium]
MGRKAVIPDAVIDLMSSEDYHLWTLEELRDGLQAKGISANFSSVFRSMERLTKARAVRKIDVEDGKSRFELSEGHHDHIRCEKCGRLAAVSCGLLDSTLATLQSDTGFIITGHSLIITGRCKDCQEVGIRSS